MATEQNKKYTALGIIALGLVALYLLFRWSRGRSAEQVVSDNVTPTAADAGTILNPMTYNVPAYGAPEFGDTSYGGLTFISSPASAFSCGENTYYSSQAAQSVSSNGQSANDAMGAAFQNIIKANV